MPSLSKPLQYHPTPEKPLFLQPSFPLPLLPLVSPFIHSQKESGSQSSLHCLFWSHHLCGGTSTRRSITVLSLLTFSPSFQCENWCPLLCKCNPLPMFWWIPNHRDLSPSFPPLSIAPVSSTSPACPPFLSSKHAQLSHHSKPNTKPTWLLYSSLVSYPALSSSSKLNFLEAFTLLFPYLHFTPLWNWSISEALTRPLMC